MIAVVDPQHMEATAPTAPPLDLAQPPAADAAPPQGERLAWGFPIGCGVIAGLAVAAARFVAPPVPPPPEAPSFYALSSFPGQRELLGEAAALPMPFLSAPIVTPELFAPPPPPARLSVAAGTLQVSGRLPPEVVQRIVHQNHGRFRACYQAGLRTNPNLVGRVTLRVVIGRDGNVSLANNGGSDLPDSSVISCVVRAMYGLNFPQPDAGIVTFVYPLRFAPG